MTGGIGSGKSEVAKAFSSLGIEVADADAIAHRLSMPTQAGHAAIAAAFDSGVLLPSGELDRAELRRRAFSDPAARARLEAALHPLIRGEMQREMAAMAWRLWSGRRTAADGARPGRQVGEQGPGGRLSRRRAGSAGGRPQRPLSGRGPSHHGDAARSRRPPSRRGRRPRQQRPARSDCAASRRARSAVQTARGGAAPRDVSDHRP